jgi:hypothetical protein
MKKILLFFLVFIIGSSLYSQPVVKIFAFEQENMPGTKPAGVTDENGKVVKKAAAKKKYFVFLSHKNQYNVMPVQVFIKGRAFSIQTITIRKTPVEYTNKTVINNPEKTILVPASKDKVLEINIVEIPQQEKAPESVKRLAHKNDVVIGYMWNKRKYFATLQKIKTLEPLANE